MEDGHTDALCGDLMLLNWWCQPSILEVQQKDKSWLLPLDLRAKIGSSKPGTVAFSCF